jgi:hypothetical protein
MPTRSSSCDRPARPLRGGRARLAESAGREHCPRCGSEVIVTPGGDLLEPEPHELAVLLPEGGTLTVRQAADVLTGRTPARGHHRHTDAPGYACRPPAQLALFVA